MTPEEHADKAMMYAGVKTGDDVFFKSDFPKGIVRMRVEEIKSEEYVLTGRMIYSDGSDCGFKPMRIPMRLIVDVLKNAKSEKI